VTKEIINVTRSLQLPFSAAIKAGDYIFVSGQAGYVGERNTKVKRIEAQTKQCLENIKKILLAADLSLEDVIKVTIFLRRAKDFARMNEVYQSYFPERAPARSTVVAELVIPDMLVEMECIAYYPPVSEQ